MDTTFVKQLRLPKTLNLPKEVTFGVEIEFENAKLSTLEQKITLSKMNNLISNDWKLKQDDSLVENSKKGFGGELVSPVLNDQQEAYKQIRNACHIIETSDGKATDRCGGHIHIGSNLLEDDIKNYLRLARLWTVFENEIVRFGLGTDELPRESMAYYAQSSAKLLRHIELLEKQSKNCNLDDFIRCYGFEKRVALSFFYLNKEKSFHTLEVRCPNGTIDPDIWKNNINFFTKFFLSCKDKRKDWNMIERMFQEKKNNMEIDEYNIDKARLLTDFVFNDEQDKNNFMLQYKKDRNKILVKSI